MAIACPKNLKAEVTTRHEEASRRWEQVVEQAPGSLDDTQMPEVIGNRAASTLRTIDDRIRELQQPHGNQAVIVLRERGVCDALPWHAVSSVHHASFDLAILTAAKAVAHLLRLAKVGFSGCRVGKEPPRRPAGPPG